MAGSVGDEAYGAAGRAAGEAVLEHGRDGARLRPAADAFLLSRVARASADAAYPFIRREVAREIAEALRAIDEGDLPYGAWDHAADFADLIVREFGASDA